MHTRVYLSYRMGWGLSSGCRTTGLVPLPPECAQGTHAPGGGGLHASASPLPSESAHSDRRSGGGYLHSGAGLAPSRVHAPRRVLAMAASSPVRSGTRVQADFAPSKPAPLHWQWQPLPSGEKHQSRRGWNRSPVGTWGHWGDPGEPAGATGSF